ncbi:MAG: transglycosylase SLT domain-containing protein [Acidobacteriota bacterium]
MKRLGFLIVFLVIAIALSLYFLMQKELWTDEAKAPGIYYEALDDLSRGKTEAGIEKLVRLMRKYRSKTWHKRWSFISGYWSLELGKPGEARKHFRASYEENDPLFLHVLYFKAVSALRADERKEAEESLSLILQGDANNKFFEESFHLLMDSMLASGKLKEAREILKRYGNRVKKENPSSVLFKEASLLEREGKKEESTKIYKDIYCLYPLSPESETAGIRLRIKENSQGSWEEGDISLLLKRGQLLEKDGLYESALDNYRYIITIFPESKVDARLNLRMGLALYGQRRMQEALSYLQKAKKDQRVSSEAKYALARIDLNRGRIHSFLKAMKELSDREQGKETGASALFALAEYYDNHGDWRDALLLFKRYISLYPNGEKREKALWRTACLLYINNDHAESFSHFHRIIADKENPYLVPALYWAAKCQEKLKNYHEAAKLYSEAERKSAKSYYGIRARERLKSLPHIPTSSEKTNERSERTEEIDAAFLFALDAARELFAMDLDDMAFDQLLFACRKINGRKILPFIRSTEMLLEQGDREKAVELLKIGSSNSSFPSEIPDHLLRLLYPHDGSEEICQIARSFSLDCNLILSLIHQESSFNPSAISRAGAIGLMQLMPDTGEEIARRLGKMNHSTSMLFRKDYNVLLGCSHFARIWKHFDGSLELSLAAYNAGEANVEKWKRWISNREIDVFVDNIPIFETRNYIKRVISNYQIYRELYGN